ncbi:hypothetical protein ABL78_2895 [Leptomonas seymouri]|uniref:Membrane-associated protein n=1 Tax=Leptomonas seymouri TaxID=5684 RepID=A0A0N0P6U3_LEPSE|nr:hypothetical protein ABL78_2895 [Leptomonas seymouri]|eukprot:KPI88019.1 hypothetical protein ABL78_2895 [Leptomonas seymouri]
MLYVRRGFCSGLRDAKTSYVVTALAALLFLSVALPSSATPNSYDINEVALVASPSSTFPTYGTSTIACSSIGGVLIPDTTNAMHNKIKTLMIGYSSVDAFFAYLGGSTSLSPNCPVGVASIECVWRWDVGRYSNGNAVPFYIGNFHAYVPGYGGLQGSRPVDISMMYWLRSDRNEVIFPGYLYGTHIMMMRMSLNSIPSWIDALHSRYLYADVAPLLPQNVYVACLMVISTTTTTTEKPHSSSSSMTEPPSVTNTTSSEEPLTVSPTDPRSETKETNIGMWAGIGAAIGAVIIISVVLLVCCSRKSCCGSEEPITAGARRRSTSQTASSGTAGDNKSTHSSLDSCEDMQDGSERSFKVDGYSAAKKSRPAASNFSTTELTWLAASDVIAVDLPASAPPPYTAPFCMVPLPETSVIAINPADSARPGGAQIANSSAPVVHPTLHEEDLSYNGDSPDTVQSTASMRWMRRNRKVSFVE